jgi:hypothetical protein
MTVLHYTLLSYCYSVAVDSLYFRDLISGMKIDRNKRTGYLSEDGRAQQVHRILEGRKSATAKEYEFSIREAVREQQGTKM